MSGEIASTDEGLCNLNVHPHVSLDMSRVSAFEIVDEVSIGLYDETTEAKTEDDASGETEDNIEEAATGKTEEEVSVRPEISRMSASEIVDDVSIGLYVVETTEAKTEASGETEDKTEELATGKTADEVSVKMEEEESNWVMALAATKSRMKALKI